MNILIIVTKAEVGGAQTSVLNLARWFHTNGDSVTVGFGEGEFLKQELEKEGVSYKRFKYLKRTHNPLINIRYIQELRDFVDDENFDVVHFNSSNALFGALGLRKKRVRDGLRVVFTFRGMSFLDPHYEKSAFTRFVYVQLFKFLLKFVDHPVFVSNDNLQQGKDLGLVKDGWMIYNGIHPKNIQFFEAYDARQELKKKMERQYAKDTSLESLDIENDTFLVGSVGRLAYQKNYEFLINIFPKILEIHPKVKLVVIGGGPDKDMYISLVKEKQLDGKVYFIHLETETALASRYLKAFDIFVLPSRYEGMPITLLETLFAGVPILATDVGGNREVMSPAHEQLYELDNKEQFLKMFKIMCEDTDMLQRLSKENTERSQAFTIEKTARAYRDVYTQKKSKHPAR